jgi:hypothetical protein
MLARLATVVQEFGVGAAGRREVMAYPPDREATKN